MKLVIFEGAHYDRLYPLTYLRPVFDLRCGVFTLKEKMEKKFPGCQVYLETREVLEAVAREHHGLDAVNSPGRLSPDDDLLLVDGRVILTAEPSAYTEQERVASDAEGELLWAFLTKETVGRIEADNAAELLKRAAALIGSQQADDICIRYPWNLIEENPEQIGRDFLVVASAAIRADVPAGVAVAGSPDDLVIAEGAEIEPQTFIDCRGGPVIIGRDALVHAHTSIHGPGYIGKESQLFEAKIREGCSIGPVCRVGGEVEESILHSHANKYHTGFLGHSYVCQWVNLGALTTNSDLKNDYSAVSVYTNGEPIDTGSLKVGAFIGDHTKTSIGTMLNTGSTIGIMCNLVAGSSVLPKEIPSFCWYVQDRISKGLGLAQALATARAAMSRRGVELTDAMAELIRHTEEITKEAKMAKVRRERKKLR